MGEARFLAGPTELPATFPADLFWSRVEKTETCWLWKGTVRPSGYGSFMHFRRSYFVHRLSWLMANGSIDPARPIDHLCRVRNCVNPEHLEQVTSRENVLRGVGPTAVNASKSVCYRGHPLDGPNLYMHRGKRNCRECRHIGYRTRLLARRIAALRATTSGEGAP